MSSSVPTSWCQLVPPATTSSRWFLQGIRHFDTGITLCYLFELEQAWLPGSKLPSTLEQVLQEMPHTATEQMSAWFETLLARVNQALDSVASAGETDWIGSLNALVLLVDGYDIHFSQTGRLPTYLLQRNRIRQITETVPNDEAFSTSPFSAISSGNLQLDDIVICGNLDLYRNVSLDALRRIMVGRSPYELCSLLAQEVRAKQVRSISTICFSVGADSTQPEQILLEHVFESPAQRIIRTAKPILKDASEQAVSVSRKGIHTTNRHLRSITTKLLPHIKHGAGYLHTTVKKIKGPAAAVPVIEIIPPSISFVRSPFTTQHFMVGKKPAILGAAILFALIGIGVIRQRAHTNPAINANTQTAVQRQLVIQTLKDATTAQQLNQTVEASHDLAKAETLISSIPNNNELVAIYTNTLASIIGAKTPTISSLIKIDSNKLVEASGWLYGIYNGSSQAAKLDGPERIQQGSSGKSQYNDIIRGIGGTVFALGSSGGIDRLTPSPTLLLAQPLSPASGTFSSGSSLASFQSNLYILDPSRQTLWKYIGDDTSYRPGTASIVSPLITHAATISINGLFYLLGEDGLVSKFSAGKQIMGFSLNGIPVSVPTLKNTALFANTTPAHLYVLRVPLKPQGVERSQVTVFTDEGVFEQTYILPAELDSAVSLTLSEDSTSMWIGTGTTAYKLSL